MQPIEISVKWPTIVRPFALESKNNWLEPQYFNVLHLSYLKSVMRSDPLDFLLTKDLYVVIFRSLSLYGTCTWHSLVRKRNPRIVLSWKHYLRCLLGYYSISIMYRPFTLIWSPQIICEDWPNTIFYSWSAGANHLTIDCIQCWPIQSLEPSHNRAQSNLFPWMLSVKFFFFFVTA